MNTLEIQERETVSLREGTELLKVTFSQMVDHALALVIHDDGSREEAGKLWKQARKWKKALEEQRLSATEPYRSQIAVINDAAKKLADMLVEVERVIQGKEVAYAKMLADQERERQERLRAAAAAFAPEAAPLVEEKDTRLKNADVITKTVKEQKFKLLDLSKVPLQYLTLNENAVKNAIRCGVQEIPGMEIWTEERNVMCSR